MKEILEIVVVFILISSFVFGFCYLVDKTECSTKARALGYSCSFGFPRLCTYKAGRKTNIIGTAKRI